MHFAGERVGIEENQIFLERLPLRDHVALPVEHQARSIEHQAVVSSNLIYKRHRNMIIAGNRGEHLTPQFALSCPERRSRNVQHKISTSMDQRFDRIHAVQPAWPEMFIVPGIFTNGERHLLPAKREQKLTASRSKISRFIENVIGGQ